MLRQFFIATLIFFQVSLFGQTTAGHSDSVIVIFKNASQKEFKQFITIINGQTISGKNLLSGHSIKFKIAVKGSNVFRFTIYTDKEMKEKYSIEPIDYPTQVSNAKLYTGQYTYIINIDPKEDVLDVKLKNTK